MSVVCVRVYDDKIQIAADSILTRGWSKRTDSKFAKLARINNIIVGSVGTAQECSLMWHFMETHNPKEATEKSVLDFVIEFSKWKDDYGSGKEIKNTYLLVFDGKCFLIEGSFVYEITNYCAIGAGEDFANAALYLGHTSKEAVKVAAELSCYVAEPIIEEEMSKKKEVCE